MPIYHLKNKKVYLNLEVTHSTQPNIRERAQHIKTEAAEIDGNFQICSSR